ncbi:MAG: hypothetical protein R3B48_26555 [Kofleriaceae bacterium]
MPRHLLSTGCVLAIALTWGCGSVASDMPDAPPANPDAPIPPKARAWSAPTPMTELNSPAGDAQPTMSADGLRVCFTSLRPGGMGVNDIWCASRASKSVPFEQPINQAKINTPQYDWMPSLTSDGLTLYFSSDRSGNLELYRAVFSGGEFTTPTAIASLNTTFVESGVDISANGLTLLFTSNRAGNFDMFLSKRPNTASEFLTVMPISSLNTAAIEAEATLAPDQSFLVYCSTSLSQQFMLFGANAEGDGWGAPAPLTIEQPEGLDACGPALLSDGSLLFHSARPGGLGEDDLYIALPK